MKTVLLILLALTALAGCIVVPAGPDHSYGHGYYGDPYPHAYPGYPYHGYYRQRYYRWQSP